MSGETPGRSGSEKENPTIDFSSILQDAQQVERAAEKMAQLRTQSVTLRDRLTESPLLSALGDLTLPEKDDDITRLDLEAELAAKDGDIGFALDYLLMAARLQIEEGGRPWSKTCRELADIFRRVGNEEKGSEYEEWAKKIAIIEEKEDAEFEPEAEVILDAVRRRRDKEIRGVLKD